MKAVIMAAGKGKRMGELTEHIPKPLIKIQERPFLYFLIKNLQKAGITSLGIVVGYKKERITDFLKKNNINAELIEQKEALGTANAIKVTEEFVGNDNFIVLSGDNLYSSEDIRKIKLEDSYCYVGALQHDHPERYGVLKNDGEFLIELVEKPQQFISNHINAGLYKFTPDIFKAIDKIELSPRGEFEITDALSILAKERKVKIIELKNQWLDLTSPEDIKNVEKELSDFSDEA